MCLQKFILNMMGGGNYDLTKNAITRKYLLVHYVFPLVFRAINCVFCCGKYPNESWGQIWPGFEKKVINYYKIIFLHKLDTLFMSNFPPPIIIKLVACKMKSIRSHITEKHRVDIKCTFDNKYLYLWFNNKNTHNELG